MRPSSGHWFGCVSGLDQVLGTDAGLGGLVRRIHPHSEHMVTVQNCSEVILCQVGWCHSHPVVPRTVNVGYSPPMGGGWGSS